MAHAIAPSTNVLSIPRSIRRTLGRVDRRLRIVSALRGFGTSALVASFGALIGMAVDVGWLLAEPVRWSIWGIWVVATLGFSLVAITRMMRKMDSGSLGLAAVVEHAFPELAERLTGIVGLTADPKTRPHGSSVLINALAVDAADSLSQIRPSRAVPLRKAMRWFLIGIAAVIVMGAPSMVRPDPFRTIGLRFVMPWLPLDRVGRLVVVVDPGDAVTALGEDLTISAEIAPRLGLARRPEAGEVELEWIDKATGRARRVPMARDTLWTSSKMPAARSFAAILPRVTGALSYRIMIDGSTATRSFRVETVPAPKVARLTARIEPPAYMKLESSIARNPDRIEAMEGSQVELSVEGSTLIRSLEVVWPGVKGKPVSGTIAADGKSGIVSLLAGKSGDYTIRLVDPSGLANHLEPTRRVTVLRDQPPKGSMGGMEGLDEATPDDTLRVDVNASDDFGVDSVELHWTINRAVTSEAKVKDSGKVNAAMVGLGTTKTRGQAVLAMETLELMPGDSMTYWVRLADNRPENPNEVWIGPRQLVMVSEADSLAKRRSQLERENVQTKLDALKKAATTLRRETEPLRYAADAAQRGNGVWDDEHKQALALREAEAQAEMDGLQLFGRELADDPTFHPIARAARQIADVEAEAARATLDEARRAPDDAKRLAELRRADDRLGMVSQRLEELQRDLDKLTRRDGNRQKLDDLADRQTKVVDQLDKLGQAADRARLDQVRAEQQKVGNELDKVLESSPELRAQILAEQTKQAEALAKRARELAERQRTAARESTDLSKPDKAKALSRLADEQRALEADARRLATEVDLPLAEAGRARLNADALRRPTEPIERGEIAEGRQRLQEAEGDLRRFAHDLEDVPGDLKALARRLLSRQDEIMSTAINALGPLRSKPNVPPDEKAALDKKFEPLLERQQAVEKLAEVFKAAAAESGLPKDLIEKATTAISRASEAVRDRKDPRAIEASTTEARNALQRLADKLPDQWTRADSVRKKLEDARRVHGDLVRDIEKHLRETDKPNDPTRGLADLSKRLEPLANRANDAAKKLEGLTPNPRANAQRDRAAESAKNLTKAIETAREQGANTSGFEPAKAKAVRDALAAAHLEARSTFERLDQKVSGQVPADDLAQELLDEQRALRDQPAPKSAPERAERLEDQRRLASALRNIQAPDANLERLEAIRQADEAVRALAEPDAKATPEKDKAAIDRAAKAAESLTKRLEQGRSNPASRPPETPRDPDQPIKDEHVVRARDLALRERRLRERLQAVLGEGVAAQEALQRESVAIGQKLGELRDRAKGLSERVRRPAEEGARLLTEEAPRAMEDAANRLAQGDPAPARDAQRRAAEAAERGAQQADDLNAALRLEKSANAPEAQPSASGALSSAREAMAEAGARLKEGDSPSRQAASQAMRAAAEQLRSAANQGPPSSQPNMADSQPGPPKAGEPKSGPAGVATAEELKELQELVRAKTGRSWGELPGHLRTEILQMSQGRYRDDYARLIQLYFREIATRGDRE